MNDKQPVILSYTVAGFMKSVKRVISFSRNPDHIKYKKFYEIMIREARSGDPRNSVAKKVVVITTVGWKELSMGLALRLVGERVFHVIHDWQPHPGHKAAAIKVYNFFAAIFFELIFHSRSQAEAFGGKSIIFPLPLVRCISSPINKGGCILAFGRNEQYKNFEFVEELARRNPLLSFIIASQGYCDPGIGNMVVYHEFLTSDTLEKLINSALAIILPYSSATQSGVIMDAYELSRPVIVSNIKGLIEYVNPETGAVIELNDFNDFHRALRHVETLTDRDVYNRVRHWNYIKVL